MTGTTSPIHAVCKRLSPGQDGSQRFHQPYGNALVRVHHRQDPSQQSWLMTKDTAKRLGLTK